MAKATTKANEVIDEKVTEQAEEVLTDAVPEATEGTNAEVPEAKDDRVEVVLPRFVFTGDTENDHHEVCVNGKIYQLQYDVPVKVPKMVAEVVMNAIEQRKKAQALVRSLDGKAKELTM